MRALACIVLASSAFLVASCASANDADQDPTASVEEAATDGDTGSPPPCTTTVGPYFLNRIWSALPSVEGCPCIRSNGAPGTMMSFCPAVMSTCGYTYCIPN